MTHQPTTVRLHDGTEVASNSEAWRHETEARAILAMQPLAKRQAWLAELERKRGKAEASRLKTTMAAIWEARKA